MAESDTIEMWKILFGGVALNRAKGFGICRRWLQRQMEQKGNLRHGACRADQDNQTVGVAMLPCVFRRLRVLNVLPPRIITCDLLRGTRLKFVEQR